MQYFADASQKFTCPAVSAVLPAMTVAVSVTTLPAGTEVTGLPADVITSVVVVAAGAAHADDVVAQNNIARATDRNQSWDTLTLTVNLHSWFPSSYVSNRFTVRAVCFLCVPQGYTQIRSAKLEIRVVSFCTARH
jgi:hypothetical protein